jgi:uncharacterized protein YgbK (DUF1537 family)
MLPSRALIADDLTGALDAAVAFASRGMKVVVALSPQGIRGALNMKPDLVAVTTASREISPDDSTRAVRAAMAALPSGVQLFKKVDSRLKGNIEAELAAIPFHRMLVAPAIPDFGRTVRAGCVEGFGLREPVAVASRLGRYAAVADIPDTASNEQMSAALTASDADLLVGARGLAEALAERITGRASQRVRSLPGPRALFLIGSRDPITQAQVERMLAAGAVDVIDAPNGRLAALPSVAKRAIRLVRATPGGEDEKDAVVANRLADAVHPHLTKDCRTLFLSGGATAEAVLRRMGVSHLELLGECLPGLPVTRTAGGNTTDGLTIVTKSGGFGAPDTLVRVAGLIDGATGWA